MPGTSTAPDVSVAVANQFTTTLHLVDASGDLYTDSITGTAAMSAANAEAYKTSYQAASNASVYAVSQQSLWIGDIDPDNALALYRASVKNGINLMWKNNTTLKSITPRLVAPIAGVMQGNQDIPLLSATEMVALIADYQALLTGFSLVSAQYTDRRERSNNPRIRA
jgi:hypothetical protein